MKFSERWLREWVDPPVSTEALAEKLTLSGLETETVTPVAPPFSGVVVAEVLEVQPHPDAERLRVCQLGVGSGEPQQVVSGAANVRAGMRVALATVGAVLPGGKRIDKAKLRGVASSGMLCSAVEVGLAESADGIMELPADAPLGQDIRDYLQLDDACIELNLTPNRGDCLSIRGIAREVAAEHRCALKAPAIEPVRNEIDDRFPVEVLAPADCPRYVGRVIRGLNPDAVTPLWMAERLRRCGLRSINAVVDITNYVMLELGQPMHAFDVATLSGGIRVRRAVDGEAIDLLDGQTVTLSVEALVVADHARAVAMAGIMGGQPTAVTVTTTDVFLESAFFAPAALAGQARRYKLQTDSSHRFERGVDFELQALAAERATRLILAICGGRAGPLIDVTDAKHLPRPPATRLRRERLRRILGFAVADAEVEETLGSLGLHVEAGNDGWTVTPPSYRPDLTLEVDLIEEVVRIGGYERVPCPMPHGGFRLPPVPEGGQPPAVRLRQLLCDRGYQEAITYSFVEPAINDRFAEPGEAVALANPISRDMSVMRVSLWPGLIRALAHNQSRQHERVRLFEIGRIFSFREGKLRQVNRVAGIVAGTTLPAQWGVPARSADFFDVKADVEALLGAKWASCRVSRAQHRSLHPGQSAIITAHGVIGALGALHHDLIKDYDLKGPVYVFELDWDFLTRPNVPQYRPLSKFPSVRRDLSLSLARSITAEEVLDCVRKGAPAALRDLQLFDVYQGEGIDSGKKSIALGLIFQESSSTLIDGDVEAMVADIVGRLASELGAALRE